MANRFFNPLSQYIDSSGNPLSGGKLWFYLTGTSTESASYADSVITTPNANPVVLNSAGRLPDDVFLDPAITYKVVLNDTNDVEVWTADPVVDPAANVTAAFQIYAGDPNGNVAGNQGSVGGVGASVIWDITNVLLYVCTTTGTAAAAVWTQVAASLSGAIVISGVISPTLSANQTDWNPTGFSTASVIRASTDGSNYTINGLGDAAAPPTTNLVKTIINVSTASFITLVDAAVVTPATAALGADFGGHNIVLSPDQSVELWYDITTTKWRQKPTHPDVLMPYPGGRLTLTTNTPVMTAASTITQGTVYYTPYLHNVVPLYNGTHWYSMRFSELSQALTNATKSPAASAADSVYDMFVWLDGATLRCTRGLVWTNATTRAAALGRIDGIWTNAVTVTNGPAANRGTYVGTIATDSANKLNMMFAPSSAAGGSANRLDVWNMYNRVDVASLCRDSTNSWTYTLATWQSANASNDNRITFVVGISEDAIFASYTGVASSSNQVAVITGVGLDSITAFSSLSLPGQFSTLGATADYVSGTAVLRGVAGLGRHYVQALEYSEATGTTTWYGDNAAPTVFQSGLFLMLKM